MGKLKPLKGNYPQTGFLFLFFNLIIMYNTIVLVLLLLLCSPCVGQNARVSSSKLYTTKVVSLDKGTSNSNGVLYALNDSSISILNNVKTARKGRVPDDQDIIHIPVKNIQEIRLRRYGSRTQGAVLGGLLGGIIGGLVGNIVYKPCDNTSGSWFGCMEIMDQNDHILVGAVLGAGLGSTAGMAAPKIHKFPIFRDQQTYSYLKDSLESYLYIPPALQPQAE